MQALLIPQADAKCTVSRPPSVFMLRVPTAPESGLEVCTCPREEAAMSADERGRWTREAEAEAECDVTRLGVGPFWVTWPGPGLGDRTLVSARQRRRAQSAPAPPALFSSTVCESRFDDDPFGQKLDITSSSHLSLP